MFAKNALGLIGLASLFGFVVACSGAPAPAPGTGEQEQTEEGTTIPAKDGKKTPATNGEKNNETPGNQTPGTPNNPNPNNPNPNNPNPNNPNPNDPGQPGEPGQAGRVSVNEHCCYGGAYYKCPNSAACFGGFDVNSCLQGCSPFDPCWDECFDKLSNAGAPKGCQANANPPAGVDCANGNINIQ